MARRVVLTRTYAPHQRAQAKQTEESGRERKKKEKRNTDDVPTLARN